MNDLVGEAKSYIDKISPNIKFIEGDAEKIEFPEKFDLIVSNAAFQWTEDFLMFFKKLSLSLNHNGLLAFSSFAPDNFKEISTITNNKLKYYENGEIITLAQKFFVPVFDSSEIITLDFDTPREVLTHMKSLGVNGIDKRPWTKKDIIEFETTYRKLYPEIKLTYNSSYFIFQK